MTGNTCYIWDTEEENSASPGSNKSKNEEGRKAQGNVCFRFTRVLFEKNWQREFKDKADDEQTEEEREGQAAQLKIRTVGYATTFLPR